MVTSTDTEGWVVAFYGAQGCIKPIAFFPDHARTQLFVVPKSQVDVQAALKAASERGPFKSLTDIRELTLPLMHADHELNVEAGA